MRARAGSGDSRPGKRPGGDSSFLDALFDTGDGHEVECASCHDPHGVGPGPGGSGNPFNRTFLRVANGASALCLACHVN